MRFIIIAAMMLAATPATAAIVVDGDFRILPAGTGIQIATVGVGRPPPGNTTLPAARRQVQTFTAATSGFLESIDFQIYRNTSFDPGLLRLTLFAGDYAAGTRDVRGSQDIVVANLPLSDQVRLSGAVVTFLAREFRLPLAIGSLYSVLFEVQPTPARHRPICCSPTPSAPSSFQTGRSGW